MNGVDRLKTEQMPRTVIAALMSNLQKSPVVLINT